MTNGLVQGRFGLSHDFFIVGGAALSLLCLYAAMRFARRKRLLENLPTSKTLGVFMGLVELKGTAEAEEPLVSYLAAERCVLYEWKVEEHWSRTVRESYTDSKGRSRTRTRRESGWKTVAEGGESSLFYLKDDTGVIRVVPDGAKIEPCGVFSETCGRSDPLYYAKAPRSAVSHSDHRRRFSEAAIPLHAPLYIVGKAREREDVVAPEIAEAADTPMFLISTRSERAVTRKLGWIVLLWSLLGLLTWGMGFVLRDGAAGGDAAERWPQYILVSLIYGPIWLLGWTWMVHNSLVRLRRRVDHAWTLIDIQLKRRRDILPAVVDIVKGLRDYETEVQTELADLRMQADATAPGLAGPDPHGCVPASRLILERYPELQAHEAFRRLQDLLVDTEQRIALAREYFNDIATFYNTRLEVVPDRWVARFGRLEPRHLWQGRDFERAPIHVSLAT